MERCEDPADPLNAVEYHTGKKCIERGCERPAGTAWSPYWCQPCNADRLMHISEVLERKLDQMEEPRKTSHTTEGTT